MRADPEPEQSVLDFDCERPVLQTDTDWPVVTDLLEMQGGMARITFEEVEILISKPSNC